MSKGLKFIESVNNPRLLYIFHLSPFLFLKASVMSSHLGKTPKFVVKYSTKPKRISRLMVSFNTHETSDEIE